MRCPKCGTINSEDSKFCKECGIALALIAAEKPEVTKVKEALAGLDCGECGYPSCEENALAIVKGESTADSCIQAGEAAARKIRAILGKEIIAEKEEESIGEALLKFVSSLKLAIILIALILLFSVIGTLIPQGQRDLVYINRYGPQGFQLIKFFNLDDIFHSWYYISLLALFSLNLVACTYKRLKMSVKILREPAARVLHLQAQGIKLALKVKDQESVLEHVKKILAARRYKLRSFENMIYGEKYKFSRLGVDILHASLLLVLIGAMIGGALGFEDFEIAHKGEIFFVPQGRFSIKVDDLWIENYEGTTQIKDWYTKLTVLQDGKEILTKTIEVNTPLTYKGISFYQASFGNDWDAALLTFQVERVNAGQIEKIGEFTAKVHEDFALPEEGMRVEITDFYPDFVLSGATPTTRSERLANPAALLKVYNGPELEFATLSFADPERQQFFVEHVAKDYPYRFYLVGMQAPEFTGLRIAKNPGLPLIYIGFALIAISLFASLYFPYGRIWVGLEGQTINLFGLGKDSEIEQVKRALSQLTKGVDEHEVR